MLKRFINQENNQPTKKEEEKMETRKGTCEMHEKIEDSFLQRALWEAYLEELGPGIQKETAFPQQCFDNFEMFVEALLDEDFDKFVLRDSGKIAGLAISSRNMKKVKSIAGVRLNLELYEAMFPELYKEKRIHYFPAMCILKSFQNEGYIDTLGKKMISRVMEDDGVAAFDYSERKNPIMADLILHLVKKFGLKESPTKTIVDQQTFVVIS